MRTIAGTLASVDPFKGPHDGFFRRYPLWLGCIFFVAFASNIPSYFYKANIIPFPPRDWIIVFGLFSLPLVFVQGKWRQVLKHPLIAWSLAYGLIAVLGYLHSDHIYINWEALKTVCRSVLFLIMSFVIFSSIGNVGRIIRLSPFLVGLAMLFNLYEFFWEFLHPVLKPVLSDDVGRSAGLFMNPNESALFLVTGMVFGLMSLEKRFWSWYVIAVFASVLITFSRSGLVLWVLVVFILACKFRHEMKLLRIAMASGMIFVGMFTYALLFWSPSVLDDHNSFNRLFTLHDEAATARLHAISKFWSVINNEGRWSKGSMGAKHEIPQQGKAIPIGLGTGASMGLDTEAGPHNIYLMHAVDYGLIGFLIFPALLFGITRGAVDGDRFWAISLGITFFAAGFINHNMLENYYLLMFYALLAAKIWNSQMAITPKM